MDSIQWLQTWYRAQCNDTWEHQYGIKVESLDNPGWVVTIDLLGTPLQDMNMTPVGELSSINHVGLDGDQDWLNCKVEANQFIGAGGPFQLVHICDIFRSWANASLARNR